MRSGRELDSAAFDRLLALFADDRSEAAERYGRTRERLIQYFVWQRCEAPEDLADEVLNRVARRSAEGEAIASLPAYCLGVARLVTLESRARQIRERRAFAEYARQVHELKERPTEPDRAFECLDGCLARLTPERRDHLLAYYTGDQSVRIAARARLATALGVGPVALRNHMLRMRQSLEHCLNSCMGGRPDRDDLDTSDTLSTNADAPAARERRT